MIKRAFDIAVAAVGLVLLSPLLALIAAAIKVGSPGPALFRQERMGIGFRRFMILKFRTMVDAPPGQGRPITVGDDPRITAVGRILRKTKLDELPQLINVLRGEMSLVGPRPEVPRYVELFRPDYEEILHVRPGITDLASLKFRNEAAELAKAGDAEEEYVRRVLPEKIALGKEYIRRSSLLFDLVLLLRTASVLLFAR
jgi:lipopolysaccharide/colanic/teichoic acid biosynthesis glycosyltransferase